MIIFRHLYIFLFVTIFGFWWSAEREISKNAISFHWWQYQINNFISSIDLSFNICITDSFHTIQLKLVSMWMISFFWIKCILLFDTILIILFLTLIWVTIYTARSIIRNRSLIPLLLSTREEIRTPKPLRAPPPLARHCSPSRASPLER